MFDRLFDLLKSDKRLMEEETALFSQVIEADEHEEQTGEYVPVPKRVFSAHVHKMNILVDRGHQTNDQGGWSS